MISFVAHLEEIPQWSVGELWFCVDNGHQSLLGLSLPSPTWTQHHKYASYLGKHPYRTDWVDIDDDLTISTLVLKKERVKVELATLQHVLDGSDTCGFFSQNYGGKKVIHYFRTLQRRIGNGMWKYCCGYLDRSSFLQRSKHLHPVVACTTREGVYELRDSTWRPSTTRSVASFLIMRSYQPTCRKVGCKTSRHHAPDQ